MFRRETFLLALYYVMLSSALHYAIQVRVRTRVQVRVSRSCYHYLAQKLFLTIFYARYSYHTYKAHILVAGVVAVVVLEVVVVLAVVVDCDSSA